MIDDIDVSTPSGRALLLLSTATYLLIIATLLGGLYHAIDAPGGERERGSLEPLLALAVSRSDLVLGKVCTSAIFMSISAVLATSPVSVPAAG
ncbi:MAG: ABC transporter permease subunit [Myxococcota bacterium]